MFIYLKFISFEEPKSTVSYITYRDIMISDDTYEEETGDLARTDPASFVKVITYVYLAC